jgi:thiamine-phosphate pyrophosphorylase
MYDLYLVTDMNACLGRQLEDVVKLAVEGGVTVVQLREKNIDTRGFIEKAISLKKLLAPYNIPLIINDRIDIALAAKADGVHVGQHDMPLELLMKIIPKSMIVGVSVETIEQAVEAESYKVDYLGVSLIFTTPTKTNFDEKPWGLEGLEKLRAMTNHKLVAIGGINKSNAAEVINAGTDGLAVVSAICSANRPGDAASELLKIIKKAKEIYSIDHFKH